MFAAGLQRPVGWQPNRFLADRVEAGRAFQLAEQLGSVNAVAAELGTTWPSLRKALPATGLECRPATPRRSASGRLTRPATAAAGRSPGAPTAPTGLPTSALAATPTAPPGPNVPADPPA